MKKLRRSRKCLKTNLILLIALAVMFTSSASYGELFRDKSVQLKKEKKQKKLTSIYHYMLSKKQIVFFPQRIKKGAVDISE